MKRRHLYGGFAYAAFALFGLLLFLGATRADPGVSTGRSDLDVLRQWIASGRLSDNVGDPSHLTKPGYLMYLRAVLPHAGSDSRENRRFLLYNAAWIFLGVGAASAALAHRFGGAAALIFLLVILALATLRDSADHLTNEPLAIGLSLLVGAGIVLAPPGALPAAILLGVAAALVTMVRPNLGVVLLLVAMATAGAGAPRRARSALSTACGFLACLALLWLVGRTTGLPLNPLGGGSSRVVLWGTADYYWKPDVGGWPQGPSASATTRLQLAKARDRWKTFLADGGESRNRSLLWRAGHGVLSAEELPSRWRSPWSMAADRFARKWWWAIAVVLVAAGAATAIAGRNPWRFVPAILIASCVGQSLLLGADPRLALPLLPLLALGLAAALAAARWSLRAGAGALVAALAGVLICVAVPDAAAFDFAVMSGPRHTMEQVVPASAFPPAGPASLHFRLLQEFPSAGISVFGNGELILRRESADPSPWPAVFDAALSEAVVGQARHEGLRLRIEIEGPAPGAAFVYYPLSPPVLGGRSSIDGQEALPSGFGGRTEGGFPVWITTEPGKPRVQRMSRNDGNSAIVSRRKAESNP